MRSAPRVPRRWMAVGIAAVLVTDIAVAIVRLPAADAAPHAERTTATPTPTPSSTRTPAPPLRGVATKRLRYAGLVHLDDLPKNWKRARAATTSQDRIALDRGLADCLGVHPLERAARIQRHRSYDDYPAGFDAIDSSSYVVGSADAAAYFASTQNGAGLACVRKTERDVASAPQGARVVGIDSRALPTPAELFGTRTTITLRSGRHKTFASYDDGVVFVVRNVVVTVHFIAAGVPPPVDLEQQLLQNLLNRFNRLSRHSKH